MYNGWDLVGANFFDGETLLLLLIVSPVALVGETVRKLLALALAFRGDRDRDRLGDALFS